MLFLLFSCRVVSHHQAQPVLQPHRCWMSATLCHFWGGTTMTSSNHQQHLFRWILQLCLQPRISTFHLSSLTCWLRLGSSHLRLHQRRSDLHLNWDPSSWNSSWSVVTPLPAWTYGPSAALRPFTCTATVGSSPLRHPGAILESIPSICKQRLHCLYFDLNVNNISTYICCICCLPVLGRLLWKCNRLQITSYPI